MRDIEIPVVWYKMEVGQPLPFNPLGNPNDDNCIFERIVVLTCLATTLSTRYQNLCLGLREIALIVAGNWNSGGGNGN